MPILPRFTAVASSLAIAFGGVALALGSAPQPAAATGFAVSTKLPASASALLKTNYAIPSGAVYVSPTGTDSTSSGSASAPYKTINYALMQVKDGGTVVARGGVYREGATGYSTGGTNYIVRLNSGKGVNNVTLQAYPGETVWMDGTVPVTNWTKASTTDYKVAWSTPSYCAGQYYSRNFTSQTTSGPCSYSDAIGGTSSLGDPQMVFVNGSEIKEVASLSKLTSNTFFYDWSARVMHLGFNPAGKTVEVTKYPQALAMLKATNFSIKGIGIRRYATNQYGNATTGALLLNNGSNVTLENVAITQNAGTGLMVWNTNKLTIRSSTISSNGANGMNFAGSQQKLATDSSVRDDLTIEYSRFDSNNTDSYSMNCTYSCNAAGVKMAGIVGANIRYSTFNYNGGGRGSGVWCDLACSNVNIYGNKMVGNARHGIVYEVSDKGVIASNLIAYNGWSSPPDGGGIGIMAGSANTRIYNNTITDNKQGVFLYDDKRYPGDSSGYGSRVGPSSVNDQLVNNIIATSSTDTSTLLRVGGADGSGNTTGEQVVSKVDYNTYVKPDSVTFATWVSTPSKGTEVYKTIAALRSAKGKETNGDLSSGTASTVLTAPSTGDFSVKASSLASGTSTSLPSDIAALFGVSASETYNRGVITLGA